MNRNSPPSSTAHGEHDYDSIGKQSAEGASSLDKEESKSQSQKQELQAPQGLYISLTTAQAYSIMRNIPK